MEEQLLLSVKVEVLLPLDHISAALPPAKQLEAAQKVRSLVPGTVSGGRVLVLVLVLVLVVMVCARVALVLVVLVHLLRFVLVVVLLPQGICFRKWNIYVLIWSERAGIVAPLDDNLCESSRYKGKSSSRERRFTDLSS